MTMMIIRFFFLLVALTSTILLYVIQLKADDLEDAQPIGFYTAGCIKNAASLPRDGIGYQVIRLSRDRFYGHPELVDYIKSLGESVANLYGGTLLIGDLSQRNGGSTPDDHSSHQIGLDADILFWQHLVAKRRK